MFKAFLPRRYKLHVVRPQRAAVAVAHLFGLAVPGTKIPDVILARSILELLPRVVGHAIRLCELVLLRAFLEQPRLALRAEVVPIQVQVAGILAGCFRAVSGPLRVGRTDAVGNGREPRRTRLLVQCYVDAVPAQVGRDVRLIVGAELVDPALQLVEVHGTDAALVGQHHVGNGNMGMQLRVARHLQSQQLRVGLAALVGACDLHGWPCGIVVEGDPADVTRLAAASTGLPLPRVSDLAGHVLHGAGHCVPVSLGDDVPLGFGRRQRPRHRHRLVGRERQVDVADACLTGRHAALIVPEVDLRPIGHAPGDHVLLLLGSRLLAAANPHQLEEPASRRLGARALYGFAIRP